MNALPRPFYALLLASLTTTLVGCQAPKALPTASHVDLKRYSGKWFEIARVKNRFQNNKRSAIAEYTPLDDHTLQIRNTEIAPSGKTRSIVGKGVVVPDSDGSRLRVKFGGLAALAPVSRDGNYWIIDLDPQYRSALVGTPNRKFLWILARSPFPDAGTLNTYMAKADRLGFPMEKLIWDRDLAGSPR